MSTKVPQRYPMGDWKVAVRFGGAARLGIWGEGATAMCGELPVPGEAQASSGPTHRALTGVQARLIWKLRGLQYPVALRFFPVWSVPPLRSLDWEDRDLFGPG
jgi:hypothetical protein